MKRTLLLFLTIICVITGAFFVSSCDRDSGTLDYHGLTFTLLDDGTYEVSGKNYDESDLTIPYTYNGKAVTRIADEAFKNVKSLKTVKVLNNITYLGKSAFYGCTSLKDVYVADGITAFEDKTFYGCTSLQKVTNLANTSEMVMFPKTVETVGDEVFYNCKALLGKLELASSAPNLKSIGARAFYGCTSINIVNFNSKIESLGDEVFYGSGVTRVTVPNSVTSIGEGAFKGCASLKTLEVPFIGANRNDTTNNYFGYFFGASSYTNTGFIPTTLTQIKVNNVTAIAEGAFYGFSKVTKITIPKTVTSIGKEAFKGCDALTTISFSPNSWDNWSYSEDGANWTDLTGFSSSTIKDYLTSTYVNCSLKSE